MPKPQYPRYKAQAKVIALRRAHPHNERLALLIFMSMSALSVLFLTILPRL